VTSSVNTNARVNVLASGENGFLECEVTLVLLKFVLLPNVLRQQFTKKGFGSGREDRETSQISWISQMSSDHDILGRR